MLCTSTKIASTEQTDHSNARRKLYGRRRSDGAIYFYQENLRTIGFWILGLRSCSTEGVHHCFAILDILLCIHNVWTKLVIILTDNKSVTHFFRKKNPDYAIERVWLCDSAQIHFCPYSWQK